MASWRVHEAGGRSFTRARRRDPRDVPFGWVAID
jgi:hypothetical protein